MQLLLHALVKVSCVVLRVQAAHRILLQQCCDIAHGLETIQGKGGNFAEGVLTWTCQTRAR